MLSTGVLPSTDAVVLTNIACDRAERAVEATSDARLPQTAGLSRSLEPRRKGRDNVELDFWVDPV